MKIIAEKINGTRKRVARAIAERDADFIKDLATKQASAGSDWLDVNAGTLPAREPDDLIWLIENIQTVVDTPLSLDSANPDALKVAIQAVDKTPMINSISGELERLERILPLVAEHNCDVIALAMDDKKIPDTVAERIVIVDKILAATRAANVPDDKVYIDPLVITIATANQSADGFMSNKDFEKFYWPTLKAVLLGLIEAGTVPYLFVEGGYNQRLDIITDPDIPAGHTVWMFDQSDMIEVKKKLGGWATFGGNVPASLLKTGTPSGISAYVKKLIDDVAGDGGYILANGAVLDDSTAENVHAMIDTGKEYGIY